MRSHLSSEAKQEIDPDQLVKILEIELARERMGWVRQRSRQKSLRAASFLFLAVVVLAALAAGYFLMTRVAAPPAETSAMSVVA